MQPILLTKAVRLTSTSRVPSPIFRASRGGWVSPPVEHNARRDLISAEFLDTLHRATLFLSIAP